jgi:hypothetical protein
VADPIILAWQLGRTDAGTYAHVKRAADYVVANGPRTPQERWENQDGWSPATIAAEIAGLVCAADLAARNGDTASANAFLEIADKWQKSVQGWTATTTGRYSSDPYYLRLTEDAQPDQGTTYSIGDSGPSAIDQRRVVDPSFLELVRLGVKPPKDPVIVSKSRSSTRNSALPRRPVRSGIATNSTATARSATARRATSASPTRSRPSGASGRSSPASVANTSWRPGHRRRRA